MCMIDDSERCTVLCEETRTARQAHKCQECYRDIMPGEKYLHESLLADGRISTHKTCRHCRVARQWLNDECGGWIYGFVGDDLREHVDEDCRGLYGKAVAMLAVGIGRKWRTRDGRLWRVPSVPKTSHERARP